MNKKKLIIVAAIVLIISLIFTDTYMGRYVRWFLPDVYDLNKFPNEQVSNGNDTLFLPTKESNELTSVTFKIDDNKIDLENLLKKTKTNAFLILHNDTLIYEYYSKGNTRKTLFKAFSATKSVLSAMIGIAIDEGKIKNINEPIGNYLDGFKNSEVENLTIKDFLNQSTGIKYSNSYMPWGGKPQTYYYPDIRKLSKQVELDTTKIGLHNNSEHNTNILGMLLESATNQPIYDYLSQKIWIPAGMNHSATFSIDSKKNKLASVSHGLNATAIDFILFGKLYLNNGFINGRQIISKDWIYNSTSLDNSINTHDYYKLYNNLWWIMRTGDYFANGHFGQRIYISPRSNTVIVRLGEKNGETSWEFDVCPLIIKELQ